MKKALSVLLAAAVLFSFAAPAVFAAPNIVGTLEPKEATLYLKPDPGADPPQAKYVNVLLPADKHIDCGAECRIYWDVTETLGGNYVTFRPIESDYEPETPRDDNTTYGTELMELGAYAVNPALAPGVPTKVTVYAQCQVCLQAWTIEITIFPPEEEVPERDDLFYILRSWWYDLKWTWDYQIHPFFKYCYYNFWGWLVSAWNMLIDAIVGLFK